MRHFLANVVTYSIAAFLFVGAGLFAWMRSAQLALTTETRVVARFEPATAHEFEWRELGRDSYVRNCASCHGREGGGRDQYPAIGHAGALLQLPGGREYIAALHIYGVTSNRSRAPMPRMGHIPDVELAAVINHVLRSFGNERITSEAALFLPAEIAARKGRGLSPADVNRMRPGENITSAESGLRRSAVTTLEP